MPLIGRRTGLMVARSGLGEFRLWDDCQQRTLAGLVCASWGETLNCWVGEVVSLGGDGVKPGWNGPQPRQGREELGFPRPAPRQMQYERRALRVSRPAREKSRRRYCSPRMRPVQRARLWAMTCTASQAPLAGKRPEGNGSGRRQQVPDGVFDLGVAAVVGLQLTGVVFSPFWTLISDGARSMIFEPENSALAGSRTGGPCSTPANPKVS